LSSQTRLVPDSALSILRTIAQAASTELSQLVVVENKPGIEGLIGIERGVDLKLITD
jgi:hypothetical protein